MCSRFNVLKVENDGTYSVCIIYCFLTKLLNFFEFFKIYYFYYLKKEEIERVVDLLKVKNNSKVEILKDLLVLFNESLIFIIFNVCNYLFNILLNNYYFYFYFNYFY